MLKITQFKNKFKAITLLFIKEKTHFVILAYILLGKRHGLMFNLTTGNSSMR